VQVTRDILLVSVNARFSHCSYATRSLLANLGRLASAAQLIESDLDTTPLQLACQIAETQPRIVGFVVYLWNVRLVESVARILRTTVPHVRLVAGGPEITADYAGAASFDAVIVGEGESAFRQLCETWLSAGAVSDPLARSRMAAPVLLAPPEDPATLALPYHLYTESDLAHRTVYVESSRGCPYGCSYCTSANTGLRLIPLDRLLPAFERLWMRGLRRFKFLDRSFNAPVAHAVALLDFFLARVTPGTRLHFEINTDALHESVAARIAAFPRNTLHLEAGVQTLNPQVAAAVGRSADTRRTLANLRFLTHETGAVVHADLIFGLPGEDEASFARGFNSLIETCRPPEVQVNLLKLLPGTCLAQRASELGLVFNSEPPYEVLCSDAMEFATLMRIQRFARCWELVHNRSRFPHALSALHASCGGDYYGAYQSLAAKIHAEEGKLFAIGLPRLAHYLGEHLCATCGLTPSAAEAILADDLSAKPAPPLSSKTV